MFASDVMIPPVATTDTITLAPESLTLMNLTGRLVPQSSDLGLLVVSDVFNRFIHDQDSDVSVHGSGTGPSDVTWLNEGIKVLQIATVLPNRGPQSVIKSISLNRLTLDFTADTAYNPATSSNNTKASFGLPDGFDFPIDTSALQQIISVSTNGQDFARLAIPKGPSTTDVDTRVIHLGFNNVPFAVSDGQQGTFNQFLAATLALKDISFSVDSTVSGLNGLNEKPVTVSDLDVNHGFPDFLLIKVRSPITGLCLPGHICGPIPPGEPPTLYNTPVYPPLDHASTASHCWRRNDQIVSGILLQRRSSDVRRGVLPALIDGRLTTENIQQRWGLANDVHVALLRQIYASKADNINDIDTCITKYRNTLDTVSGSHRDIDWPEVLQSH
ncbi:hypothetical protein VKT23_004085 [Stygiomarasmius scandens]|uniref:Uncharacterized protein n=1 Tax=Marasmiellus scandens TaxID=2682957 RepID=A0ABR1JUM1_9AGAR